MMDETVDPGALVETLLERYDGTVPVSAWGERGVFYNPDGKLARGTYFLTIKDQDGENDRASHLDREGVYRVSFGVRADTYRSLFGDPPGRPPEGGVVETGHDFTALDELLPHPVYAWAAWVCVLCPTERTFGELEPLVDEAYALANERFSTR